MKKDISTAPIILNPVSGTLSAKEKRTTILAKAKSLGWNGSLIETSKKQSATDLALKAIKQGSKHIIVCGGDGTLMEVIGATVNKDITVGIVPLGTGNLFAQNLDISLDIEKAVEQALNGSIKKIDVGLANKTYFCIMAGIGLDAEMIQGADRKLKKKLGVVAYIGAAIKGLFSSAGTYEIQIDNKDRKVLKAKSIMVANMGTITGGFKLIPKAHPQSGNLRIAIIQAKNWHSWVNLFFHAVFKRIDKSPHYTLLKGKEIQITCIDKKRVYECDGEDFPETKTLSVTIFPSAASIST